MFLDNKRRQEFVFLPSFIVCSYREKISLLLYLPGLVCLKKLAECVVWL